MIRPVSVPVPVHGSRNRDITARPVLLGLPWQTPSPCQRWGSATGVHRVASLHLSSKYKQAKKKKPISDQISCNSTCSLKYIAELTFITKPIAQALMATSIWKPVWASNSFSFKLRKVLIERKVFVISPTIFVLLAHKDHPLEVWHSDLICEICKSWMLLPAAPSVKHFRALSLLSVESTLSIRYHTASRCSRNIFCIVLRDSGMESSLAQGEYQPAGELGWLKGKNSSFNMRQEFYFAKGTSVLRWWRVGGRPECPSTRWLVKCVLIQERWELPTPPCCSAEQGCALSRVYLAVMYISYKMFFF